MMEWAAGAASFDSGAAARPPPMWGAAGAPRVGREVPGGEVLGIQRWGGAPTMARPAGDGGGAWRPGRSGVASLQLVPEADLDGRRRNRPAAR